MSFVRFVTKTLRDNLVTSGAVTPLVDLPVGFFHALIVSRFDALEPPEQTVLKAGTGASSDRCQTIPFLFR